MPSFDKSFASAAVSSDPGLLRSNNEDAFLCLPACGCFAVSDGMGGGEAGELASQEVVVSVKKALESIAIISPLAREDALSSALGSANNFIRSYSLKRHFPFMGATVACLLLDPWNPSRATVHHAGDSRVYLLRGGRIEALTRDHSMAEAAKIPEGKLPKNLQGVLTHAVGITDSFFLDRKAVQFEEGDHFLLCTDGLSRLVQDAEIAKLCDNLIPKGEQAVCDGLVAVAKQAGGNDNITVIFVSINALPAPHAPSAEELEEERLRLENQAETSTTPTEP